MARGKLPEWDDLRGRAPEATGKLSSEDFVRKLRDEWEEKLTAAQAEQEKRG